jgi:hypothetical protein
MLRLLLLKALLGPEWVLALKTFRQLLGKPRLALLHPVKFKLLPKVLVRPTLMKLNGRKMRLAVEEKTPRL